MKIIICGCERGRKISPSLVDEFKNSLSESGKDYIYIEDLCGSVINEPEKIREILSENESVLVGCHSRALQNLIRRADIDNVSTYHIKDSKTINTDEVSNDGKITLIKYNGEWKPWFPVIDYDKCTGCKKCLNFCLFGVYTANDEGKIDVSSPANCKDMCPACARVCPEGAIIFSKHEDSPIDGGESTSAPLTENLLDKLQTEDVYKVLKERRKAFKTELFKKEQFKIAEEERRKCSSKNKT